LLDRIDAIEVWNAAYNTRYLPDPWAIRLLKRSQRTRPELMGTAGLDQHDGRNDRETRVVLANPAPDPLAELRAGRFLNRGRTMAFDAHVSWSPLRVAALMALRRVYDSAERLQNRLARARGIGKTK